MGYLNEPYGDNQANLTVPNARALWPSFWKRVEEHAGNHNVSTDEIKIVGPSIASKDGAMRWGEDFYFNLPENIRIDALNVHEYNINGGQQGVHCNCEPKLLRDTLRKSLKIALKITFASAIFNFKKVITRPNSATLFGWSNSTAETAGGTARTSSITNT